MFGDLDKSNQLDFEEKGNVIENKEKENIDYQREVLCNKDIEMAYWVCPNYDVITYTT